MSALQQVAVTALERARHVKTTLTTDYGEDAVLPAVAHFLRGGQRVAEVWIAEPIGTRTTVLLTAMLGFSADCAAMVAEGLEMDTPTDPRTGLDWAGSEAVASYMDVHGEASISRPALVTAAVNAAGDTYGGVVGYEVLTPTALVFDDACWTVACTGSEVAEAMAAAQRGASAASEVRAFAPDLAHLSYDEAVVVTDKHTADYLRAVFEVWVGLGEQVPFPAQA